MSRASRESSISPEVSFRFIKVFLFAQRPRMLTSIAIAPRVHDRASLRSTTLLECGIGPVSTLPHFATGKTVGFQQSMHTCGNGSHVAPMIFHNHLIMQSLQISSDSPLFKNAKAVTYLLRGAGLARVYIRSALRTYLISVRQHGFCRITPSASAHRKC